METYQLDCCHRDALAASLMPQHLLSLSSATIGHTSYNEIDLHIKIEKLRKSSNEERNSDIVCYYSQWYHPMILS